MTISEAFLILFLLISDNYYITNLNEEPHVALFWITL